MQRDDWSAGFVDLRRPHDFRLKRAGTLLVVDYPEEIRPAVGELLRDLAGVSSPDRLRVLFLTRRGFDDWQELIDDNEATNILNKSPVLVGRLEGPPAHAAFCSVQERAGKIFDSVPLPLSEDVLATWLDHAPENQRALFVVAAALHSAMEPDEPVVHYTGREVVEGLVRRELTRLRRTAGGAGLSDRDALARLLAMAAIADHLEVETIRALASDPDLDLGLPHDGTLYKFLGQSGLLSGRAIHAPKPDIVASCLVVNVFGTVPERAPEWLWAAAAPDLAGGIERLVRLSHDAEVVLGLRDPTKRLSEWMAAAIGGNGERSRAIDPMLDIGKLTIGTAPLYVAAWSTLHGSAQDDGDKAHYLSNLSVALNMVGDGAAALEANRESVEIRRRLAATNPARFEPELATSLNNQSTYLSDAGDGAAALDAIREAAEIHSRLAAANPARFEPDLAMSLNNLSNRLSDAGEGTAALEAIREAVEIRRRLAASNPARFEPDLASSLNNLSAELSDAGDGAAALEVIREAAGIYRRLAAANPARFEPNLAMSLNNLSNRLSDAGEGTAALEAIREAVEIRRRLAASNPARFEPDLASSLNNLSNRLSDAGDGVAALEAIREAVEIYRRLAAANPARFEPDLARSMGAYGTILRRQDRVEEAADAFREGIALVRPHVERAPNGPHARLLETLERELERTLA